MAGIKDTAVRRRAPSSWPLVIRNSKGQKPKGKKPNRNNTKHRTKSRKTKARTKRPVASPVLFSKPIEFTEVKGKTVQEVKLYLHHENTELSIFFADRTNLSFSLEPRVSIRANLSDWKTHNWRDIKTWPAMMSESSYVDD